MKESIKKHFNWDDRKDNDTFCPLPKLKEKVRQLKMDRCSICYLFYQNENEDKPSCHYTPAPLSLMPCVLCDDETFVNKMEAINKTKPLGEPYTM